VKKNDQRITPIEILNFNYYENNESKIIYKLIDENFTIFDIGANFGWYSINFSNINKGIRTYAFEPIPNTYKKLVENIKLNDLKNIETFNFGLYNKNTDLTFYYYPQESGNASSVNLKPEKNSQEFKCKVIILDDFIKKNKINSLDFIKCDVEGAEIFVFEGGKKSIELYKPIIFTEMLRKWSAKFGYHPNKIIDFFEEKGYGCFVSNVTGLTEITEITEETIETNFFFLHEEKHANKITSLKSN